MPFVTLPDGVRRSAGVVAAIASHNLFRVLPLFYNPGWLLTHLSDLAAMQPALEQPVPPYAQEMHRRASAEHDSWDRLPSITAPTLVIHGGQDQVVPVANAHLLAERIPGAELHLVPRGRHIFYVEFRTEVNRVVSDFLLRHPLQGRLIERPIPGPIIVTLALAGLSEDRARFRLRNELFAPDGKLAARVISTGAWLDLAARKLTAPPESLAAVPASLGRTDDFQVLQRAK